MGMQSSPVLAIPMVLTGSVAAHRLVTPTAQQTAADGIAIGASRSAGVAGERITVDVEGTTTIETGAAIALGATLKSDASGRVIPWATSGARVGFALEAATAAGQFIEVLLRDNA